MYVSLMKGVKYGIETWSLKVHQDDNTTETHSFLGRDGVEMFVMRKFPQLLDSLRREADELDWTPL